MKHRPLFEIAQEIRKDWKNPNFAAEPYIEAMEYLDQVTQNYGVDSGSSVVGYFLSNSSAWRGEVARRIKVELNQIIK